MNNEKLIEVLSNCIHYCNYCANACLNDNDVQEMVDCMRMNHVCAEVCGTLSHLLMTDYKDIRELMEYCIRTCERCAEECEKHDQQHCKECAKACRECVEACRKYLN